MMAAERKISKEKEKKAKKPSAKKVWHIYHFEERYELPDDVRYCRKSPLLFTRDFVGTGQDDEAISYRQQMGSLHHRKNDGYMLKGIFADIKNIAANRSRAYRGYLLDEKLNPATDKKIAQWLGLEDKTAKTVLKDLADVGLIERVPLPTFDLTVNDKPGKDKPDDQSPDSEPPRNPPEPSGGPSRKKKKKVKSEKKKTIKKKNEKNPNAQGNTTGNILSNGSATEQQGQISTGPKSEADVDAGDNHQSPAANVSGTQPDPIDPTRTQAGGVGSPDTGSPPNSVNPAENPPLDEWGDSSGAMYASTIFRELRTWEKAPADSKAGRSELASFASLWSGAVKQHKLNALQLQELYTRSVESAKKVTRRPRKKYEKPDKDGKKGSREKFWAWKFGLILLSIKSNQTSTASGSG